MHFRCTQTACRGSNSSDSRKQGSTARHGPCGFHCCTTTIPTTTHLGCDGNDTWQVATTLNHTWHTSAASDVRLYTSPPAHTNRQGPTLTQGQICQTPRGHWQWSRPREHMYSLLTSERSEAACTQYLSAAHELLFVMWGVHWYIGTHHKTTHTVTHMPATNHPHCPSKEPMALLIGTHEWLQALRCVGCWPVNSTRHSHV